ncbi:TetR/AcrR family transcriptional regulator [Lactobacillus selangorensis]|nr:TetR/AcrR family transcriptional regulator [Lactobacillus selangorensis]
MKRVLKKQQVANRILQTATQMFTQEGYHPTQVAAVAKRAHVSKVTLYKYYPSKLDLGNAVLVRIIEDGYAAYGRFLDDPDMDFDDKLRTIMSVETKSYQRLNMDFVQFVLTNLQGKLGPTSAAQAYNAGKKHFWLVLIKQGRAEGKIDPHISDDSLMIFADMFINYFLTHQYQADFDVTKLKEEGPELLQLFFYGFVGKQA